MKKLLLFVTLLAGISTIARGQWNWTWRSPTPTGSSFNCVWDFSATDLIAVGGQGLIMRSTDGGATWSVIPSGVTRWLSGVYFLDADNGWACGEDGLLMKTTNHGAAWQAVETGANSLYDICFVGSTGWACGSQGTLIKTTDAGADWTSLNSGTSDVLYSIAFKSATEGYVAGGEGTVLRTVNGGGIWGSKSPGTSQVLNSIKISGSTIFVFGDGGTAYKTTDGGTDWSAINSGLSGDIIGSEVVDANNIWVVGTGNTVYKSTDGGSTWLDKNPWVGDIDNGHPTIKGDFHCACFSSSTTGLVCGDGGVFYNTTNDGTTWTSTSSQFTSGDATAITFSDSLHGFFLTDTLFRTTNGGTSWSKPAGAGDVRQIQLFPNGTGIRLTASGGTNHFETTSDNGATWTSNSGVEPSGPTWPKYYFASTSTGYAVSYTGGTTAYKTTNGGVNWTTSTHDYIDIVASVAVPDANTIWLLEWSDGSNILLSTNGGGSWIKPSATGLPTMRSAIFAFDASRAWVGTTDGKVYKTTDGGSNFTMYDPAVSGTQINDIRFLSTSIGFVAAAQGGLSMTTDGGSSWVSTSMGSSDWTRISAASSNSVFISGKSGHLVEAINGIIVGVNQSRPVPVKFALQQNFPNPFNPSTVIRYYLPTNSHVVLKVYDVLGREVATVVDENQIAGSHEVKFNGDHLPSGVYFYAIRSNVSSSIKKMLLLK